MFCLENIKFQSEEKKELFIKKLNELLTLDDHNLVDDIRIYDYCIENGTLVNIPEVCVGINLKKEEEYGLEQKLADFLFFDDKVAEFFPEPMDSDYPDGIIIWTREKSE